MKKTRSRVPIQYRRPVRISKKKRRKAPVRRFRHPELRWMDQLLRSFSEETPPEWIPSQYKPMMDHLGGKKRTLH